MNARARLASIVEGIRQDLARCQDLRALLTQQQALLANQDAPALAEIGARITPELEALDKQATERSQHLTALGLSADDRGMQRLIAKLPDTTGAQLAQLWQQLHQALAACQSLNERNGQMLAAHRQAVSTVTGQSLNPYDDCR